MYNIYKIFPLLQYVNQRLQTHLELLMMRGIPLETCSAFNERWNNKFYYMVATCWLFLLNQKKLYTIIFNVLLCMLIQPPIPPPPVALRPNAGHGLLILEVF
jgi:hypothetical protein